MLYGWKKVAITCWLLYLFAGNVSIVRAQTEIATQDSLNNIVLYFRFNRSLLEKDYMTNKEMLERLREIMLEPGITSKIDSITIKATASPDGALYRNRILSVQRAAAVKSYLMWQYPFLDKNKILTYAIAENWEGLKQLVMKDPNVPCRKKVIGIIDSADKPEVKDARLRQLDGGKTFEYITHNMLRFLRSGTTRIFLYRHSEKTEDVNVLQNLPVVDSLEIVVEQEPDEATDRLFPVTPESPENSTRYKRPLALKTNVLYDALSLLNVGIEVPVSKRFSLTADVVFPWWLWEKQQNCLEILAGTLEGRYWLKPVYKKQALSLGMHNPLAGWFLGAYGSMGKYDLEWKKRGYQGEFSISTGLSVGYVFAAGRNLNIELSLSAGYLQTNYRYYEACQASDGEWHLIKQYSGIYHWVGPTRLNVSLLWYPHFKSNGKGGSRK